MVVKKFGTPTLVEEASGRIEHVVTISEKRFTKVISSSPSISKFNYQCSCAETKTFCIHLAIVFISDFYEQWFYGVLFIWVLGKPTYANSAVFFNIVQTAFDPKIRQNNA